MQKIKERRDWRAKQPILLSLRFLEVSTNLSIESDIQ